MCSIQLDKDGSEPLVDMISQMSFLVITHNLILSMLDLRGAAFGRGSMVQT